MQVKCDQCGTEYAVEDARVPEAGVQGKCTQCGHVFPLRRTLHLDFDAVSKKLEKAVKTIRWRIRKAGGEELEFSDLGTLRRWIVEKKVHSEDEISKTGDDWKPLGAIVSLSKMFTSPESLGPVSPADLRAKRRGDGLPFATAPSPAVPASDGSAIEDPGDDVADQGQRAPPAPSSSPQELIPSRSPSSAPSADPGERSNPLSGLSLPTGSGRLTVREDLLSAKLPSPPTTPTTSAALLLDRGSRLPSPPPLRHGPEGGTAGVDAPPVSAPAHGSEADAEGSLDDSFSLRISDSLPGLQRQPVHSPLRSRGDSIPGLPLPAPPTGLSFQGEPPPATHTGGRGFLSGVVAAIAVVGAGYFVFDRFIEPSAPGPTAPAADTLSTDDALALLDRAAAAYARDTEEGRRVADLAYTHLLDLLPDRRQRSALARRAHLGRARVALNRAEYAQLDGVPAAPYLDRAARAVAAAQKTGRANGAVALVRADMHRLNGATGPAREALEAAEAAGAPVAELAYVRASLERARDPAATLARLDATPPGTKALPRFAYLRAVTLQRVGRDAEARRALESILAAYPGHVGAQRRLSGLAAQAPAASTAVTPPSSSAAPSDPSSAPSAVSAPGIDAPSTEAESAPVAVPAAMGSAEAAGPPTPPVRPEVSAASSTASPPASGPKTEVGAAKTGARAPKPTPSTAAVPKAPSTSKGATSGKPGKGRSQPKGPKEDQPAAERAPKRSAPMGFDRLMSQANGLLEHGRARDARTKFLQASRQRPSSPEPWANLGWCELELRRTVKAISYFEKSLGRNPRYADALYGLGMAYERKKDTDRARTAYRTYLAVNPRGSKARMVQRRLDRLK